MDSTAAGSKRKRSEPSSSTATGTTTTTTAHRYAPFTDAAQVKLALATSSVDLLRQGLTRLRNQTALVSHDEVLPANDPRIKLVCEYLDSSPNADELFAAWNLAAKQNLPTLLPLPLFVLAQILKLLGAHYPNHSRGETLITRLLGQGGAPGQGINGTPYFQALQSYIGNAQQGGPKGKQASEGASGGDVMVMASLRLLVEVNSFAQGKFARAVFDGFGWGMKTLAKLLSMRRKSASNDRGRVGQDGLSRPDIRTLYMLFLLSFLTQTHSHSLKIAVLDLGREHCPSLVKNLVRDPPEVVQHVLVTLHAGLLQDERVPRAKKVTFFNEWACEHLLALYSRSGPGDVANAKAQEDSQEQVTVADLAHHFMLALCTHPGFGICYADRGWYPRIHESASEAVEATGPEGEEAPEDEEQAGDGRSTKTGAQSGKVYNKVLAGVLRIVRPSDDLRMQELALRVMEKCPELVAGYWTSAGLTLEPRSSSKWLSNAALVCKILSLPLPIFGSSSKSYPTSPPPLSITLENLMPTCLPRAALVRGLQYADRLVRHFTALMLACALERARLLREEAGIVAKELGETHSGRWTTWLRNLERELRKRVPELSSVVQMQQSLASAVPSTSESSATPSLSGDVLLTEVALRCVWLYHAALPGAALESRFDVGKLLAHPFMRPGARGLEAVAQQHALRIVERSPDWAWAARAGSSSRSYFCLLLTVYSTTPLAGIRASCASLFASLVAPSALFEHDQPELGLWLHALPSSDASRTDSAQREDSGMEIDRPETSRTGPTDAAGEGLESVVQALSDEQAAVLIFVDDCVQRCLKTPYRYIEAARQALSSPESVDGLSAAADSTSELAASPLLLTLVEQLSIRARKRLLDATGGRNEARALLAFLTRLLLALVGRKPKGPLLDLARQVKDAFVEAETSQGGDEKVIFAAQAMVNALDAVENPPSVDMRAADGNEEEFGQGNPNPAELRELVRNASRPLSAGQVRALVRHISRLTEQGFGGAKQLLSELSVGEENMLLACAGRDRERLAAIVPPSLGLLHAPNGSSASAANLMDTSSQSAADAQCSASIAIHRLSKAKGSADFAPLADVLRKVIATGLFDSAQLRELIFEREPVRKAVDQEWDFCEEMISVTELALDPVRANHRALVVQLCHRAVGALEAASLDSTRSALQAVQRLLPFFDDETLERSTTLLLAPSIMSTQGGEIDLCLSLLEESAQLARSSRVLRLLDEKLPALLKLAEGSEVCPALIALLDRVLIASLPHGVDRTESSFDYQRNVGSFEAVNHADLEGINLAPLLKHACEPGVDGLLMRLIYRSATCAHQLATYLNEVISGEVGQEGERHRASLASLRRIPHALYACVELLSHGSMPVPSAKGQAGTSVLGAFTATTLRGLIERVAILSYDKTMDLATTFCASAEILHRYLSQGDTASGSELGTAVPEELLRHLPTSPKMAFKTPILALCANMLRPRAHGEEVVGQEAAKKPVRELAAALSERGLAWLVQRFAEDETDSEELLDGVDAFVTLINRGASQGILPKLHLADPVIEAALKNRLTEPRPMRLVAALLKYAPAKTASLSKHLALVLAHHSFASVANGSPGDTDQRRTLVRVVHTIISRDPANLGSAPTASKLLSIYGGTLSSSDRRLFNLFGLFERHAKLSLVSLVRQWTPQGIMASLRALDAVLALDPARALATCTNFPRARSFKRTGDGLERGKAEAKLRASLCDPAFVLALLAAALAERRLTGLEWLAVLRTNALGVAVCALSSTCVDMRIAATVVLGKAYAVIKLADFQEQDHLQLVLEALRNCLPATEAGEEATLPPPLPSTTTLFVAHNLRALGAPATFTYPIFSRFLLQRPLLDAGDVPLLYNMLHSDADEHKQERVWMLRFLRDTLRGRQEWRVFKRRHVWDLLASLYASSPDDRATQALVREVILSAVHKSTLAHELIARHALLPWIFQQQALHPGSHDPAWLTIVERATASCEDDFERLDKATDRTWIGETFDILRAALTNALQSQSIVSQEQDDYVGQTVTGLSLNVLADASTILHRLLRHLQLTGQRLHEVAVVPAAVVKMLACIAERAEQLSSVNFSSSKSSAISSTTGLTVGNEDDSTEGRDSSKAQETKLRVTVHHLFQSILSLWHTAGIAKFGGGGGASHAQREAAGLFSRALRLEVALGGQEARALLLGVRGDGAAGENRMLVDDQM